MIEIVRLADPGVTAVLMRGTIPPGEFDKLPITLCGQGTRDSILFDWSDLQDWPLSACELKVTEGWAHLARSIRNAAIVHHCRWNRQAAWIAALLRLHNVNVRSWRHNEADRAIAWLKATRD